MSYKTIFSVALIALLAACGSKVERGVEESPQMPPAQPSPQPSPQPIDPPDEAEENYLGFESAAVRPIATYQNWLFVTNTSNHSVEMFSIDENGIPSHEHSIKVGLEPVALAISTSGDLWVVNHVSDSISIVDINTELPFVKRTLLVGDEPRDIVFANGLAFITSAHRGQHLEHHSLVGVPGTGDPQLHTPGVERADVWIFDPNELGASLGGTPVKITRLFGDSPRALAVSPDQKHVYAAVFNSGNQTTAVHEAVMCPGFEDDIYGQVPCQTMDQISAPGGSENGWLPGGRTAPGVNADGVYQPWTSMIVKYDRNKGQWLDSTGRNFSNGVRFSLPDLDVFTIDTSTLENTNAYAHVGTTLFNLAVHPTKGDLLITNTEANNHIRFEGEGNFAGSTVQGNIAQTRLTYIDLTSQQVKPRHLNRHIDYHQLKSSPEVKQHSLSTATQVLFSQDGGTVYMAAMGSDKIAIFNSEQLGNDIYWDGELDEASANPEFDPTLQSSEYLHVTGGPVGIELNEAQRKIYVYTRFDNALVTVDLNEKAELARQNMPTPESESYQAGRFMLYDANRSSSNGESSCASCHVFGDTDHLSWNLGNPDASNTQNLQPFPTANMSRLGCDLVGPEDPSCQLLELINGNGDEYSIASMKGPMTTQTMRGMSTHGHLHWRGDRVNGYFGNDTEQTLDERQSFKNFIVAFEGLLGMDIELPTSVDAENKSSDVIALEEDMDKFADFMLSVMLPPNPVRGLDNSLSTSASIGQQFFHGERRSDGLDIDVDFNGPEQDGQNCAGCHGLEPENGFYGTRGEIAHGGEIQILKVPHLRNLYTRVGMFGLPDRDGFLPSHTKQYQGDQIRGFGFLHDGATDQLLNFLKGGVFDNGETPCPEGLTSAHGCNFSEGFVGIPDEATRQGLVDYMMEFENDLAPIVGQQITLNQNTRHHVQTRIDLLEQRAKTPFISKILGGEVTECDLVATGVLQGEKHFSRFSPADSQYHTSEATPRLYTSQVLREFAITEGSSITFTCAVPGQGHHFESL